MEKPYKEDFTHHCKRRKMGHDYKAPCKYHITIAKAPQAPACSSIQINSLTPEGVTVKLSPLGEIIKRTITHIPTHNPKILVLEHIIMPDHIHML